MINVEYANAYTEVLEILKHISLEDYNKIPKNKIELFEAKANSNYKFLYNPEKTLEEQGVSKKARAIIAILFRDYWATEVQRDKIIEKQRNDRIKLEEEKQKKYNTNVFNERQQEYIVKENSLLVKTKESFYQKIINFIKRVFNK